METTHPTDQDAMRDDDHNEREALPTHHESSLHFFAREAKLVLRWAVFVFGAATVLTFMTFFFFAIIPAIALVAALALLMIAHAVEQQSMKPGDPHDETAEDQRQMRQEAMVVAADPDAAQKQRIEEAVERKTARIVAGIIVCVAVAALIIAGAMFGRELFIIGGFILFAYMLLVATPVWLGWLNDQAEDETHRLEDRTGNP